MGRKNDYQGESSQHKELKKIAKVWLLKLGVSKVDEEVRFNPSSDEDYAWNKGVVIADVVGYSDSVIIAVECGGSKKDKLISLSSHVSEIYILPYGQLIPFRWSALDNLCHICGNRI